MGTSGQPTPAGVRVWDLPVRIFHWSLAASIAGAVLLAEWAREIHEWLGYFIAALLAARLIWGFIGSRHARFSDFVPTPQGLKDYARALLAGRERRYLGHNPAGGAMALLLMGLAAAAVLSGWYLTTDSGFGSELGEEVHEAIVDLLLLAIPLHIAGVIFTSLRHRENLVAAMWHGYKRPLDANSEQSKP